MYITTGTKKNAVTELMLNSVGENTERAMPSQNSVMIAPPIKHAGISIKGFAVPDADFTRCGTAMPTKDIGPANAVTHAESRLERSISATLSERMFTPMFCAYRSPS